MIPLIFYDIPSKLEGNYWSPNTAKSRFILGCKGLPFRVEWVEYCDIAPRMKEIGARQNKLPDGRDGYTLPVLNDPNTGALITDSWEIAEYLEKTYPEKPIFPNQSKGLIRAFDAVVMSLLRTAFKFPMLRSTEIMNERGAEYFIAAREEGFKEKFSEFSPEGPKRDEHWANLERMFDTSKEWYDEEEGKWLMGDVFSYADIIMAARLFWFERVLHDDEWEKIANWHGGRWAKLLADVEKEYHEV
ncbi:hypothetical protein EDD16DRAFT_805835 [Pisolithus croceorrhizus]|nr:hypothetical protein EDD16DRAFT_805835 [Pisolithus croceorrhizus]KAI6133673.1 hypothetical protein EV401DRAFT_2053472 [Pisolithus croceorrhizus]KAI6137745.1 hypothetical protein EDD17DRAFT_420466 [Pisolithus thermaeus]